MEFCPDCSSILSPQKNGKKKVLSCQNCGYTKRLTSKTKEKYRIGYTLLAHKAPNEVIAKYIKGHFGTEIGQRVDISKLPMHRTEKVNIKVNNKTRQLEIPIVGIPDFLKKTGQLGHVGLGRWNDIPVIWVDSKYFYTENDALKHDREEVAKWEKKRLELSDAIPKTLMPITTI